MVVMMVVLVVIRRVVGETLSRSAPMHLVRYIVSCRM